MNGERTMGIIKIAVCDDEVIFAEKLKTLIGFYCNERQIPYVVDIYCSGRDFLADNIKMMKYQILFLDINMDDIDGLQTAKELRKLCGETFLIFVTAYINYTIEGYKVDAIRYLLKTDVNFEQSVNEGLDAVFKRMEYVPVIKQFCFQEGEKNIALEKIVYVESDLHKLSFHIWDEDILLYTMYETLNNVSKMFTEKFIRIHQSYLVNLSFVKRITGNSLILFNGENLPIARSKIKEVRNKVAIYKGEI